jgi:hypothetical protein
MPRKKELLEEKPLPITMVSEQSSAESVKGVRVRPLGWLRLSPVQFLCVGLVVALCMITFLYVSERSQSNRERLHDAKNMSVGGLDITNDDAVLQAVSELMILPADQDPIIAMVADATRLQSEQAFYRGAENGDVLLVFPQSRQAIIYRPNSNKIVNAGPLIVDDNEQ